MNNSSHILVIGASGFLGRHLVDDLIEMYPTLQHKIVAFDIRKAKEYDTESQYKDKINFIEGDLCDEKLMRSILVDHQIDTLIHCATPPVFASDDILRKVNIDGTKALLSLCKESPYIKRFILTSSSSVCYDGKPLHRINEKHPYASKGYNVYTDTKIAQETMVLKANDNNKMRTVALRPAGIFGPRDELFLGNILKAAKSGRANVILGDGQNEFDATYVKNISYALILAAQKIDDGNFGGEAFFITNGEHTKFWDLLGDIQEIIGGYQRSTLHIPYFVVYIGFLLIHYFFVLFSLVTCSVKKPPVHLDFEKLMYLTKDRSFDISKAQKTFGYKPKYTTKQALEICAQGFDHYKNPKAKKQQ